MKNEREIKRVLGKSHKTITTKQNGFETTNAVKEPVPQRDVVSELIDNIDVNQPVQTSNVGRYVSIVIVIFIALGFIIGCSKLPDVENTEPPKVTQSTPVTTKQEAKPTTSTYDAVMERTASNQSTKTSNSNPKPPTPVQPEKKEVNKPIQPTPQVTPKKEVNQTSAKSAYLKEVKDLLNEIYEPIFEIDYARMKINFARMTVAQIDGEYTGGAHNLYMFLLSNMIMLPTFHDDYGNTCSIIITVRNSKVTDVSLAE